MKTTNKISRAHARLFGIQDISQAGTSGDRQLKKLVEEITLYCNREADLPQVLRFLKRMRYHTEGRQGEDMQARYLVYIIDIELEVLEMKLKHSEYRIRIPKPLKWTGTYVALVMLIYALQRYLNRGKAQLQDIVACFEFIFQVRLGNYSTTLDEARRSRYKALAFFDTLKQNLADMLKVK